jgi:hypothetical protein
MLAGRSSHSPLNFVEAIFVTVLDSDEKELSMPQSIFQVKHKRPLLRSKSGSKSGQRAAQGVFKG